MPSPAGHREAPRALTCLDPDNPLTAHSWSIGDRVSADVGTRGPHSDRFRSAFSVAADRRDRRKTQM